MWQEVNFSINGAFHFRMARPDDITINYRNIQRVFVVGKNKPPSKRGKKKRIGAGEAGKKKGREGPTLIERQIREAKKHLGEVGRRPGVRVR